MSGSGGVVIPQKMRQILAAPGFIGGTRGDELRNLYSDASVKFDCRLLNEFAMACFLGSLERVTQMLSSGQFGMAGLGGVETGFEFGYASLVVLGRQRVQGSGCNHNDTLKYLLSQGVPPDIPDICGHTALHHSMIASPEFELAQTLVRNGANIDQQERYGGVPLLLAFRTNRINIVDLLMEAGANLDIADADGITPMAFFLSCGPQVTAAVRKWIRKRNGEEALLEEKICGKCGKKRAPGVVLKHCSKCHSQMYCSTECQRADWKTHKKTCKPFSEDNTIVVKPSYHGAASIMPLAALRSMAGLSNEPIPAPGGLASSFAENKDLIIKVQVPWVSPLDQPSSSSDLTFGPIIVYNKKRSFRCSLVHDDDPIAYRRITAVVREKGVGGAKAYFPAVLRSRDQLAIKITDVLAEQSF